MENGEVCFEVAEGARETKDGIERKLSSEIADEENKMASHTRQNNSMKGKHSHTNRDQTNRFMRGSELVSIQKLFGWRLGSQNSIVQSLP